MVEHILNTNGIRTTRACTQWVEESFTNFGKGINWRSYVVCDVAYNNVNNWLWSPFIDRGPANRLYIEIQFTIRDCSLFPGLYTHTICDNTKLLVFCYWGVQVGGLAYYLLKFCARGYFVVVFNQHCQHERGQNCTVVQQQHMEN